MGQAQGAGCRLRSPIHPERQTPGFFDRIPTAPALRLSQINAAIGRTAWLSAVACLARTGAGE
jgi:hypothetical protein